MAGRFPQHLAAFHAYCAPARARPEVTIHPPSGGGHTEERGSAPEVFRLHLAVLGFLHDRSAAWDIPCGEAEWYHMEANRAKGVDVDYITEESRRAWRELEAKDPETAAACRKARAQWLAMKQRREG
jgi:hypothetical protein